MRVVARSWRSGTLSEIEGDVLAFDATTDSMIIASVIFNLHLIRYKLADNETKVTVPTFI